MLCSSVPAIQYRASGLFNSAKLLVFAWAESVRGVAKKVNWSILVGATGVLLSALAGLAGGVTMLTASAGVSVIAAWWVALMEGKSKDALVKQLKTQLRNLEVPRSSRLFDGPFEQLLRQGPPGKANVWYPPNDAEAHSFASSLTMIMRSCGWQVPDFPRPIPPNMLTGKIVAPSDPLFPLLSHFNDFPAEVRAGGMSGQDVSVEGSFQDLECPTPPARPIDILAEALYGAGFRRARGANQIHPPGCLSVIVCQKQ